MACLSVQCRLLERARLRPLRTGTSVTCVIEEDRQVLCIDGGALPRGVAVWGLRETPTTLMLDLDPLFRSAHDVDRAVRKVIVGGVETKAHRVETILIRHPGERSSSKLRARALAMCARSHLKKAYVHLNRVYVRVEAAHMTHPVPLPYLPSALPGCPHCVCAAHRRPGSRGCAASADLAPAPEPFRALSRLPNFR